MKKMNYQYSLSAISHIQNSKKRKKIVSSNKRNNQNPVKLMKPYLTNFNSISNVFNNSNLNFSKKSKFDFEEEFEIIEPSLQNTIRKSKDIIPINNHTNSSNRNLNSNNTGFTTNADSKSLNLHHNYNDEIYCSISLNENNKMKIIKKPIKNYGLSARELMDIVNKRKKILGLRSNYSNHSNDNYHEKSDIVVQNSLYYDNFFNDPSNSIGDNNFINMSFSQINTLKLSNIKKNTIKKKLVTNPSKDIVNFIFDDIEDEKEKNNINKETINLNINDSNIIRNDNKNNNENNYQKVIPDKLINQNNDKDINETKVEESLFNIEKNPNEETEINNLNDFKIESNTENTILDNDSPEKSSMLNNSLSSQTKLSISSSNKEEEVIQIDNNIQNNNEENHNETKDIIDISSNVFNINKKEMKKEETITKQKINFFEETLNKIPKKENKDKINENLLKLLPPSPNIMGNRNLIKFAKKKKFNENNKEKHVRSLKSFDVNKERKIDFQPSDYCILKTSSLEKKSNRSYSKNSRNKKVRQVGKYTDFYKKKINEIVDEKKIKIGINFIKNNNKKKHFILKVKNKN